MKTFSIILSLAALLLSVNTTLADTSVAAKGDGSVLVADSAHPDLAKDNNHNDLPGLAPQYQDDPLPRYRSDSFTVIVSLSQQGHRQPSIRAPPVSSFFIA
jgi:hypothetical protein